MTVQTRKLSYYNLSRKEREFVESLTGLRELDIDKKEYGKILSHYAQGCAHLGDISDVVEMASIADAVMEEGFSSESEKLDTDVFNTRIAVAYNRYRALPPEQKAGVLAKDYVKNNLPAESDSAVTDLRESLKYSTDRAAHIINYLRDTGREFTIVPDMSPGQVRAELSGDVKLQVRLLDSGEPHFIGRAHLAGAEHYLQSAQSTSAKSILTGQKFPVEFSSIPLKYALGDSIPRYYSRFEADGTKSYRVANDLPNVGVQLHGAQGSQLAGWTDKSSETVDAYVSKGTTSRSHSAMLVTSEKQTGNRENEFDIRIITTAERSVPPAMFVEYENGTAIKDGKQVKTSIAVDSPMLAEDYLLRARDEAKANFVSKLGIGDYNPEKGQYDFSHESGNALDYWARLNSLGFESEFTLNANTPESELQNEYLRVRTQIYDGKHIGLPQYQNEQVSQWFDEWCDLAYEASADDPDTRELSKNRVLAYGCEHYGEDFKLQVVAWWEECEQGETPEDFKAFLKEWTQSHMLMRQDEEFAKKMEVMFGERADNETESLGTFNAPNILTYMRADENAPDDFADMYSTRERHFLRALKVAEKEYELTGEGYDANSFSKKHIAFDAENAKNLPAPDMQEFENLSDFWKSVSRTTHTALSESGMVGISMQLDDKGVIQYNGTMCLGAKTSTCEQKPVTGTIGQIFEPINEPFKADGTPNPKHGLIPTNFNTDDNGYIAPGKVGWILDKKNINDKNENWLDNTVWKGYEDVLRDNIKISIRGTLTRGIAGGDKIETEFDRATSLNYVYKHLYDEKYPFDFEESLLARGMSQEDIYTKIQMELACGRIDTRFGAESNLLKLQENMKLVKEGKNLGYSIQNNVFGDELLAILKEERCAGRVDHRITSTAKNQGLKLYFVDGGGPDENGRLKVVQKEDGSLETKSVLTKCERFRDIDFSPPDRGVMAAMNYLNQVSVAQGRIKKADGKSLGVGTAHMSLGGYTQDDGFVVSKEFADDPSNMIFSKAESRMRPLKIGDKICDFAGNKGVISAVIDRNADVDSLNSHFNHAETPEGASFAERRRIRKANDEKDHLREITEIFRDNSTLDVVGAPHTGVSRFNGACARRMIRSQSEAKAAGVSATLKVNGKEILGGIGYAEFVITDMPVDEKTKVHDDKSGRNLSSQLATALVAAGCFETLTHAFKFNTKGISRAREVMIAMGCDITQTGKMRVGYEPQVVSRDKDGTVVYEQRNVLSVEEAAEAVQGLKGKAAKTAGQRKFSDAFDKSGGFMELPFEIQLASGVKTNMLPVMSSKYRVGHEFLGSESVSHEFTRQYRDMYETAIKYCNSADEQEKQKLVTKVQSKYDDLSNKIDQRFFSGKHNMFKMDVMRTELPNSASAIISADPMLDPNEIRMTVEMAEKLGLKLNDPNDPNGPSIVMWRDPVLSDGGVRCPRVVFVETREGKTGYNADCKWNNLVGIQMNPVSTKSLEADFDGDSVGLWNPKDPRIIKETREKLGYSNNMLNLETATKDPKTNQISNGLYYNNELDIARAYHDNPELKAQYDKVERAFNALHRKEVPDNDVAKVRGEAALAFADNTRAAFRSVIAKDVVQYDSFESHVESIKPMVRDGVKGSFKKFADYCKYVGVRGEDVVDSEGKTADWKVTGVEDKSLASSADREASYMATHAKSVLTGIAGKMLQRATVQAKSASDEEKAQLYAQAGMALTHPVTQKVMQLKHDGPEEVMRVCNLVQDVVPALWEGYKIKEVKCPETSNMTFEVVKNDKNYPVRANPQEWSSQVEHFYTAKHGLNVGMPNPKYVAAMAECMTVYNTYGKPEIQGYSDYKHGDPAKNGVCPNSQALDDQAFYGSFKKTLYYAQKEADLFGGYANSAAMPGIVRQNRAEAEKAEFDSEYIPKLRAFGEKDTRSQQIEAGKEACLSVTDVAYCLRAGVDPTFEGKAELQAKYAAETAQQASEAEYAEYAAEAEAMASAMANVEEVEEVAEIEPVQTAVIETVVNAECSQTAVYDSQQKEQMMYEISMHFNKFFPTVEAARGSLYEKNPEALNYYDYMRGLDKTSEERMMFAVINTEVKSFYEAERQKQAANQPPVAHMQVADRPQALTAEATAGYALG